jgi:hypothetical protein
MRIQAGSFRAKSGKDGSTVYLHRLVDGPRPEVDVPPRPAANAERADPDTLHAVYSALLDRLSLSEAHREALHGRGMADDAIDRAVYRTLPIQGRSRIVRDLQTSLSDP